MKTIDSIPTGKISRAAKLVKTGVKVGGNYLKYYGNKLVDPELDKEALNASNAEDIYDGLKDLKGSALKAAQMLSMEKNLLPSAYVEKFSLSQFSVPPLSAPLVRKTFRKYFGKNPEEIFDEFSENSVNAASIGQVHKAVKDGKNLAVKIQYPGVADSISSDLALVKPIAVRMFNLKGADSEKYFKEVETKLEEETDYLLELKQSEEVSHACGHIPNLKFPRYYKEYSTDRILTMDWMDGLHLSEFAKINKDQTLANKIGQALWDFYMFQIHKLRKVHADPHPGNFLINDEGELIAIDFGCMKEIPEEFYTPYFELAKEENINNTALFNQSLKELEIIREDDSTEEAAYFSELFSELLGLFTKPFNQETFDFSDKTFFDQIAALGQKYAKSTELRKMNGNRGSKHFLYINRTFFGLYSLLHDLGSKVEINAYKLATV
ncbi:ABC1 kinase family protein [Arcticibacterium luteifluviistationis]|uniref:ABC transporter n=1 Tax=Arcticibacterium luteifluviistationis TaxID=1784714 RepID=A0A2Z4G9F0_9BACT|nr:AarF/ABC1/UbiB kinase family protein [Arcticibacterium luteifluviistationis]AWV97553.1 ABC transporter [Arcticibacterium luteifluviistationis]